jgi:glycine/D-amino acid oxidase-like deaminating enzyme
MSKTFDVVIVGAGLMGCSSAFQLARRGLKVAVVEKESIGAGSTGRSSAIVRQHYSNELTARMALYGAHVFQHFDEEVGGECGFEQTGFLALVPQGDREGLEANVALQQSVGIETSVLSPEELLEVLPGVETSDIAVAAYEPGSGYADPHLTVNGYADAARRYGAHFLLDTEVTGIRFSGDHVVGVDTPVLQLDAPMVVNCAGPWGARIAQMANVSVPINACRVQVAVFRRPAKYTAHPVVLDFVHATYFRAETGNLSLVGLIDPHEADDVVDPDYYREHLDTHFVSHVGERWLERCPAMEYSQATGGYAGLYAVTPDWHPIVDEVPPGSGCFICAGFSGHGFKLAPAVGAMTADLLTGESSPQFPAELFRLERYAEQTPVRGQYEYSITG